MLLSRHSTSVQAAALLGWLGLVFAAAALGAIASTDAPAFYGQLAKPSWAPPSSVFGPVWSVLYALMGVAAWLVWREPPTPARRTALQLFLVQLGANALWSWLFFAWHTGSLAFAEILMLLTLVIVTTATFWRIRRAAGVLLLPYVAWVAFATVLTFAIWQGNLDLLL